MEKVKFYVNGLKKYRFYPLMGSDNDSVEFGFNSRIAMFDACDLEIVLLAIDGATVANDE